MSHTQFTFPQGLATAQKTSSLKAYEAIWGGIVSGLYKPGDALREMHLAKDFGVSQSTIREALLRLESGELVVRIPHSSTVVKSLSRGEAEQRMAVRATLEESAVRLALSLMSDKDFDELDHITEGFAEAIERVDGYKVGRTDFLFHRFIWERTGNAVLAHTLEQISSPWFATVSRIRDTAPPKHLENCLSAHREPAALLRKGDVELAAGAIRENVVPGAIGQELRGRIGGTVADTSGAVIPAANVTLINDNTNGENTAQTSKVGQYLFDFVLPGTYTIRVESDGFRSFEQRNILIQTRADITVNAALEIGAISETVTVEEAPVAVSFSTTTMESTLDTKMSQELPLLNRNPYMLAALNPAVNYRGGAENAPYHHWAMSQLDVGGNTSTRNNVLMDGVPQLVGAKGVYTPPMDAVSEVNVQQNSTDAEYGHSAGGIISVQMKSGTNDFHGSAYYFGRQPFLNPRPNSFSSNASVVKRNVRGVSSGNPIVKNKVFNYLSYEGQDVRSPSTVNMTLPTPEERGGDFSNSFNRNGGLRTIHDPMTTDPNGDNRTPFANNVIPAGRLDQTSLNVMDRTWTPNNAGDNASGANNYRIVFPITFKYWNFTNRTDYNISDSVKVFGRFSRFHTTQSEPDYSGSVAQRRQGSARNSAQASGDIVWTINPTTVFNVRGSWSKITDSFSTPEAEIGEAGLAELWPGNNWYASHVRDIPAVHFPEIDVRADGRSRFGRSGFWFQEPTTYNLEAKISKQVGRHYVKFGGQYRKQLVLAARPRGMRFRFRADPTADTANSPNTGALGHAWASMLLGVMDDSYSRARTVAVNRPRIDVFGFFVQDDFKLSQRVTLNLGLRYEYETPMQDPTNRISRFLDFNQDLPELRAAMGPIPADVLALRTTPLDISGGWVFADSENRRGWQGQKNLFLPRAGIAIRLDDRTALRIGYARYATPPIQEKGGGASDAGLDILGSTPYPGFEIEGSPLSSINGTPRAFFGDPFPSGGANPNPLPEPFGQRFGRNATLGSNEAIFFHQDWQAGINDRFNFSLQRELFSRIVMDATFFTNFGHDQPFDRRHNLLDPRIGFAVGSRINDRVDNPFFGVPQEIMPGPLANQRTVRVRELLTPYPHYRNNGITERVSPGRNERYSSLQLQFQRPFANGFNFVSGYNYHRARNENFYDEVDEVDQVFRYRQDLRGRHKFTLAGIYELPFGQGKSVAPNARGVFGKLISGWQVSSIYVYAGGELLQFNGLLVNGDPALSNPNRERMFNTDAFSNLPAFTRRSNPWTHDGVHGPRFSNIDMTFAKRTKINERLEFEFRMESYNLTNSFNGQNPSTNVNSGNFGRVSSQVRTHFGREWQYSGRFIW